MCKFENKTNNSNANKNNKFAFCVSFQLKVVTSPLESFCKGLTHLWSSCCVMKKFEYQIVLLPFIYSSRLIIARQSKKIQDHNIFLILNLLVAKKSPKRPKVLVSFSKQKIRNSYNCVMTCINWIRKQISSIELTYANHEKKNAK